jgi:predicted ArsR family transcriptional regulator
LHRHVGRRSGYETISKICVALLEQGTWTQAQLARRAGVDVASVKERLEELVAAGVPLESERDGNQVYWSVPTPSCPNARITMAQRSA